MIKRFFSQAWLTFKSSNSTFSFETFLVFQILAPLFGLISTCVIAGYSFNTDNLTWWVVGSSFVSCASGIIFTLGGTFMSERYMGTLKAIIVSPSKKIGIIFQKSFYPILFSIGLLAFQMTVGSLIFRVNFSAVNFGLLAIAILAAIVAAVGFAMFLSVFTLMSDSMHMILNTVYTIVVVFCGASFPTTQLPQGVQIFSYFLPLTRTIQAANMLFTGFDGASFLWLVLGELGIAAIYFTLGVVLVKIIEKLAIKRASFDAF